MKLNIDKIILLLAICLGFSFFAYKVSSVAIQGSSDILSMHTHNLIDGLLEFHEYPLFLVGPALFALPFGADIGIKIFTILLATAYIGGTYLLALTLGFTQRQALVACLIASIPVLPPYSYRLESPMVAMLLPGFLVLYFRAVKYKRRSTALPFMLAIAALPFLHAQFVQAVFIVLALSIFAYWHDDSAIIISVSAIFLLLFVSWPWFRVNHYVRYPIEFITGNIQAVMDGKLIDLGRNVAEIMLGNRLIQGASLLGYLKRHIESLMVGFTLANTFVISIVKNHRNKELKLLLMAAVAFSFFYLLYLFRITEAGFYVTMRMYYFILPVSIVIVADLIGSKKKWRNYDEENRYISVETV